MYQTEDHAHKSRLPALTPRHAVLEDSRACANRGGDGRLASSTINSKQTDEPSGLQTPRLWSTQCHCMACSLPPYRPAWHFCGRCFPSGNHWQQFKANDLFSIFMSMKQVERKNKRKKRKKGVRLRKRTKVHKHFPTILLATRTPPSRHYYPELTPTLLPDIHLSIQYPFTTQDDHILILPLDIFVFYSFVKSFEMKRAT